VTVVLASAAVLAGAAFMFVAGLGVVRFPDLLTRMHAAAKPATVGVAAIMGAVALAFADGATTVRALLVASFFLLTAPVAAHAIARSAVRSGVPLAPGTQVDPPRRRTARSAERAAGAAARERGGIGARVDHRPESGDASRA
jgi:multicomponent Na+:H+ antiporter subunit G